MKFRLVSSDMTKKLREIFPNQARMSQQLLLLPYLRIIYEVCQHDVNPSIINFLLCVYDFIIF